MEWIQQMVLEYPAVTSVFIVMGVLRAALKPVMHAVGEIVIATPSKVDDEKWEAVKASKYFKVFAWILDYTASIKIK
jgi:hypothetical protein